MSIRYQQQNGHTALGHLFFQTAWTFQGIAAVPAFSFLGTFAFYDLVDTREDVHKFTTHFVTSIIVVAIIFLVLVQPKLLNRRQQRDVVFSRSMRKK